MTPATLQALRRLLFFSTEEAAAMIGGVSPRSWQYWERGERRIPEDVAAAMRWLCEWRTQAISSAHDRIEALLADRGEAALIWYPSIDDWLTLPGREPVMWRPQQSVCAALLAEFTGCVTLVAFDGRTVTLAEGFIDCGHTAESRQDAYAEALALANAYMAEAQAVEVTA